MLWLVYLLKPLWNELLSVSLCPVQQHVRHRGGLWLRLSGRASKTPAEPLANLDPCQDRGPAWLQPH